MKLNRHFALVLVLFGVVGLALSLWNLGDIVFVKRVANAHVDVKSIPEMIDVAGLSSIFSIATIGFGLYNWDETILAVFGIIGVFCSILAIVPLLCMAFLSFLGVSEYIYLFEKLFALIVCANLLFVAAIMIGSRNSGRR